MEKTNILSIMRYSKYSTVRRFAKTKVKTNKRVDTKHQRSWYPSNQLIFYMPMFVLQWITFERNFNISVYCNIFIHLVGYQLKYHAHLAHIIKEPVKVER